MVLESRTMVVLRCAFTSLADALDRHEQEAVEPDWTAFVGANGARFVARAVGDATLLKPDVALSCGEELALHVREVLGDVLDAHEDERGVACLKEEPAEGKAGYEAIVDGIDAWVEKVGKGDTRLERAAGWMFGAAAKGLQTDDEVVKRVKAAAEEDPMLQAEGKLEEASDKREDRSALKRSLGAVVGSSFLDSPLAKPGDKPGLEDLGKERGELASVLTGRGDKAAALESTLREVVEGDVASAIGDLDAIKPPPVEEDETTESDGAKAD
jgi:hypothetical protein